MSTAPQSHSGTLARAPRVSASEYDAPHSRHDAVRIDPWTSIGSRARQRVQPVDVLRDHARDQPAALELGDRAVRAVGLLAVEDREALAVEVPEARRVAPPDVDVGDLHRVDVRPQAGHRRAEVGDAGRHGDAGAGQHDHRAARRASSSASALAVAALTGP